MATTDDREISEKIDFYDVDTKEKGESFATQAEEENSPIPIVAATVSLDDDPTLPAVTFRFWVLGTFFAALGAGLNEFYQFRAGGPTFSTLFVQLASYLLGNLMARTLPTTKFYLFGYEMSLNPGPFNRKEHAMIAIAASSGAINGYASSIIAAQNLYYKIDIGPAGGVFLLIANQLIGYGIAGMVRDILVRPSAFLWPVTLVSVSLYNTLHDDVAATKSKIKFFGYAFLGMFVWQWFPSYIFPFVGSLAVLCWVNPYSQTMVNLSSSPNGLGILNFSLDWNIITTLGPLYTPFWAYLNQFIGIIFMMWFITPLLYYTNFWNAQTFPILSSDPYTINGTAYPTLSVIGADGQLNQTAYAEVGPVWLSVNFSFSYIFSFIGFTATITHVACFYGKDIWDGLKKARHQMYDDIHVKKMKIYKDIPHWWYLVIFVACIAITMALIYIYPFNTPWWGILVTIVFSAFCTVPIGVIQAISNNQFGINVMSEFIAGYMLPGRPQANIMMKGFGFQMMYQCLFMAQDLKLGLYMKIPPRAMFLTQIWGTFVGCFFNYLVMMAIINSKREYLDGTTTDPTGQWTGINMEVFYSASILWGLIGPARMYGPGTLMNPLLWGFLIGAAVPPIIWLLHKKWPKARFDLFNFPIFSNGAALFPGYYSGIILTPMIINFFSMFWASRYRPTWFEKYNFLASAAFDAAAQITTMVIFFCLTGTAGVLFPNWWGNDAVSYEKCYGPQASG